jgi:hypothetical protein
MMGTLDPPDLTLRPHEYLLLSNTASTKLQIIFTDIWKEMCPIEIRKGRFKDQKLLSYTERDGMVFTDFQKFRRVGNV